MTDRLYYHNSFLYDFVAALEEVRELEGRTALVLDRTAFYPTSGGQVFDTGWIELEPLDVERKGFLPKLRVAEVAELEDGSLVHFVEGDTSGLDADAGIRVRGFIDVDRRRDHMQQHSGQHILSAAFDELDMPTVSFHMGEDTCTIDLDTKSLSPEQVRRAEERSNQVVWDDRPVSVRYVSQDQARELGLRKIPPAERDELRLVEVQGFDLCACGGTHVRSTGQVGIILCRKVEKVKQGFRVEFVCGERALRHARKDYETLTDAAGLFSAHVWDVSAQVRKSLDDSKLAAKAQQKLVEEVAELRAAELVAKTEERNGRKFIVETFSDRDLNFVKLFAQKLTQHPNVVALLGTTKPQVAMVFAQTPGMPNDMGKLMKEALASVGGRGGGSKDLAQGGVPDASKLEETLRAVASSIQS